MTMNVKCWTFWVLLGCAGLVIPVAKSDQCLAAEATDYWRRLHPGLELGEFPTPQPAAIGDSLIRVLRIDPSVFHFKLLNASSTPVGRSFTAREWCRQNGLVAAINASMYQTDYKTSVSYMRTQTHINNPRLSKDMTILAFDRRRPSVPMVKIIDRQCDNFKIWKPAYATFIQSIRMISCTGGNVWSQQPKRWSTAAIAIDRHNNVLFIHVRSPFSTHDLINMLRILPLGIERAMYVEGGPEAQMYVKIDRYEFEFVGSYESDYNENDRHTVSWPVPNVVGIALATDP